MSTKEKNLINTSDINANKADEVKKMHRQDAAEDLGTHNLRANPGNPGHDKEEGSAAERNLTAHSEKGDQDNKRPKGAESRDSDRPYEDVITPESYDTSVEDKDNMDQADQAAL